jgi:ABC-type multidrug transport system ATPase subunit
MLLLDEPLTNLDEAGEKWYSKMLEDFSGGRTIIVCSNMNKQEYEFLPTKTPASPNQKLLFTDKKSKADKFYFAPLKMEKEFFCTSHSCY